MSVENLKSFQEKLLQDKDLQTKVKEKFESLEKKPETEKEMVETILIPLASEANLPFLLEEYEILKEEKNSTLSEEELESVSGGTDMVGTTWAVCVGIGAGYDDEENDFGGRNCIGLGFSFCVVVGTGY